jgi:DNA-binding NarL/FixJ family response regulator
MPTILIVDDNALVRSALCELFKNCFQSIQCGEAENGAEALVKAEELRPDLILLDFSMPVMNGLEAAKILNELLPGVPVFLVTAHCTEATVQAALQVGVRGVFSKHHDLTPLVAQARQAFEAAAGV